MESPPVALACMLVPPQFVPINGTPGGLGNLLLRVSEDGEARVLKVYRRRRGITSELLTRLSHRWVEGKRGPAARERCETERLSLDLWRRHGFDVPRRYEADPPDWIGGAPFLWLEHVPGESLFWLVRSDRVDPSIKDVLVGRLARSDRRRHRLALEQNESLLLHEHPTTKHTVVHGHRLIAVDLEGGYRSGYPLLFGVGNEIAGVLRSLWLGSAQACFSERLTRLYLEGYGDPELLREACRLLLGGSFRSRMKRWSDRRRRGERSKTEVMTQLLQELA